MDTATEYCPLDKVFFPLSVEFGESLAQNNIVIHVSNAAIIETSGEVGYERATVFKYNKTSRGKKPFHILFEDGVMSRWGWEEVASPQLRFFEVSGPKYAESEQAKLFNHTPTAQRRSTRKHFSSPCLFRFGCHMCGNTSFTEYEDAVSHLASNSCSHGQIAEEKVALSQSASTSHDVSGEEKPSKKRARQAFDGGELQRISDAPKRPKHAVATEEAQIATADPGPKERPEGLFCVHCNTTVTEREEHIKTPAHVENVAGFRATGQKLQSCEICTITDSADKTLMCDACNKDYHMFCLSPKLKKIPSEDWFCPECTSRPRQKRHNKSSSSVHSKQDLGDTELSCAGGQHTPNALGSTRKTIKPATSDNKELKESAEIVETKKEIERPLCPECGCKTRKDGFTRKARVQRYWCGKCGVPVKLGEAKKSELNEQEVTQKILKVGVKLKAKLWRWARAYSGTVMAINNDGTFHIKFEDGEEVKSVKLKYIVGGKDAKVVRSDTNDPKSRHSVAKSKKREKARTKPKVKSTATVVKPARPPNGGCTGCQKDDDHGKMLLCDGCDAEYHLYCLSPPLQSHPTEEIWCCPYCVATGHDRFVKQRHELRIQLEAKKPLGCKICKLPDETQDSFIMLCDGCDGEYHGNCLVPPLTTVPDGEWFCPECTCTVGLWQSIDTNARTGANSDESCSSSSSNSESDSESASSSEEGSSSDESDSSTSDDDQKSDQEPEKLNTELERETMNVLLEHKNIIEDGNSVLGCRIVLVLSPGSRRSNGRIVRYDSDKQLHLVVLHSSAAKWVDLSSLPCLVSQPYMLWAKHDNRKEPAEVFTPYGPSHRWFEAAYDPDLQIIVRVFEKNATCKILLKQACSKKALYGADGSITIGKRGVSSATGLLKEWLHSLLKQAQHETKVAFRVM